MSYLFDTDILVDLLRGDSSVIKKIEQKNILIENSFVSVLSVFELIEGAHLSNNESELNSTINLINNLNILDLNKKISLEAGKISSDLKKKGKYIGIGDILIGTTAIMKDKILVTRNAKHFSMIPNLKLIIW